MYTVVVGIDDNEERAIAQAEALADMPGSEEMRAILLHDFTTNPEGASVGQVSSVRRARERLEAAGIEIELEESSGEPAEAILREAEDEDADMICVAGRKRTPTGKVLFGSVTQAVILDTDRPVLVCSASAGE